ncbi:hypothetical protein HY490_02475 [Candidatus Woesearchaeota archaeon]|nr:hypothetical protein [Candidatus Woesearchaeota archaeon]
MRVRTTEELRGLLSLQTVVYSCLAFGGLVAVSVILQNYSLMYNTLFSDWSLTSKASILAGVMGKTLYSTPGILLALTGTLMGANIALRQKTAVCGVLGAAGAGCAACGISTLSVLGLAGIATLPMKGLELSFISIALLLTTLIVSRQ